MDPSDLASVGSAQKNSSLKNWCSLKGSKMPSTLMISPVTAPPIKAMARVTSNATNLKQANVFSEARYRYQFFESKEFLFTLEFQLEEVCGL